MVSRSQSEMPSPATLRTYRRLDSSNVTFDDPALYEEMTALLRLRCPECLQLADNVSALRRHVEEAHNNTICVTCCKGRKVFPSEQKLYERHQISKHLSEGDRADAKSGFSGIAAHPRCKFCDRMRCFDEDELRTHQHQKHFRCDTCMTYFQREVVSESV